MTRADARRVVLDTNVLVSLFIFDDPRFREMLARIVDGRWQAFTNEACFAEWRRVLARSMFGLDVGKQEAAAARWQALATHCAAGAAGHLYLPRCRDADDQKFLELAIDAGADWLVTSDKALLALWRRRELTGRLRILTPEAALAGDAREAPPNYSDGGTADAQAQRPRF